MAPSFALLVCGHPCGQQVAEALLRRTRCGLLPENGVGSTCSEADPAQGLQDVGALSTAYVACICADH